MSVPPGRHKFGPTQGRVVLRTYRQGLAASAGHDLIILLSRWSAELTVAEDSNVTALNTDLDMTSLTVQEGVGGVKPLSDRDKREIAVTARKQLSADRAPQAFFRSSAINADADGSGTVTGTLSLAGVDKPFTLQVAAPEGDRYRATGQVVQSEFGIKPYSGFFGALKLRDAVDIELDIDLSGLAGSGG